MEIVRLSYCEHAYAHKALYKLINIGGDYFWEKRPISSNVGEIRPLYISDKDNRYLAFCMGMYHIRFREGDL